ncbi:MAG: DUF4255 domain-containing protein [Gammaproteobacteria bacterium]|jgi:hypothetical protein
MIDDLDSSIASLLQTGLPQSIAEQLSISFLTPDEDFPPQTVQEPAINLFLYDIRENRELRSGETIMQRTDAGRVEKKKPPARVDCSYLVTAWVSRHSQTQARDEHHLLGEVMRVLLQHPTLPAQVLQGELVDQQPPLPTISLHSGRLQSPGEFWQALGGKPKAGFHYTVTIGIDAQVSADIGVPVTDKLLKFEQHQAGSEGQ